MKFPKKIYSFRLTFIDTVKALFGKFDIYKPHWAMINGEWWFIDLNNASAMKGKLKKLKF